MREPIFEAVDFVKKRDVKSAREILGLKDASILDSDIVDSLMSFQKGLNCLLSGDHARAVEPLRKSLSVINKSVDSESQFFITLLADFAEGIARFFLGDAIGAYNLLNYSADAFEKASFFIPDFTKVALSAKATAHMALVRTYFNMGDVDKAESLSGAMQQIYSELISRLDEEDENDLVFFVEANGVQLEFITTMSIFDLNVIDFDAAEKRLMAGKTFYEKLIPLFSKLKDSPIKLVVEIDLSLYSDLQKIIKIGKKVIVQKDFLEKIEIAELEEVDHNLFTARSLSYKAQDRGKGYIFAINQLSRFQERLLVLGKIRKKDVINVSGFISLISFIVLLFSVDLTIRPSGDKAILYFFGELIMSLIVGFGYGALRFIPLIKLFSKAAEGKKDKVDI